MIEMLFRNLVSNSIKYRRGERVRITFSARIEEHYVDFIYADNGEGFASDKAEAIFDAFTRLKRHDTVEGSGVGLSLCRSIVERHHGRIWARGAPGRGARFFIRLPTGSCAESLGGAPEKASAGPAPTPPRLSAARAAR